MDVVGNFLTRVCVSHLAWGGWRKRRPYVIEQHAVSGFPGLSDFYRLACGRVINHVEEAEFGSLQSRMEKPIARSIVRRVGSRAWCRQRAAEGLQ